VTTPAPRRPRPPGAADPRSTVFATEITVIGNVVTSPSSNRTQTGSKVTNFRLASTERRYDSASQGYVDGNTFWIDVECWGDLGGNVSHSVAKGDPVVVVGTITTHEWENDQGRRSRPQIKAEAVAPNLARGTAEFKRTQRASGSTSSEDEAPTDASSEQQSELADLIAGRDYERDLSVLDEMNSDEAVSVPALR
jgi:single stranded DNA-binding protein